MKITTSLALALTMLLAMAFGVPKASAADGKDIFLSSKCTKCHSLKSAGIEAQKSDDEEDEDKAPPPDLSGIKSKHDSAWLHGWLTKEIENDDGKKHKLRFRGEEEELDALVAWLLEQ